MALLDYCLYYPYSKSIYDAYDEVAQFGIEHGDIRWQNILHAYPAKPKEEDESDAPLSLVPSSIASPNTGKTYPFRLVDFEMGRKTNYSAKLVAQAQVDWLEGMVGELPVGGLLGQNEEL